MYRINTRALLAALLLALTILPLAVSADTTAITEATVSFADNGNLAFTVAPNASLSFGSGLTPPVGSSAIRLEPANAIAFTVTDSRLAPAPWSIKASISKFEASNDSTNTFGGFLYMQNLVVNSKPMQTTDTNMDAAFPGLQRKINSIGCNGALASFIAYDGAPANYRGAFEFNMPIDPNKTYFSLPVT